MLAAALALLPTLLPYAPGLARLLAGANAEAVAERVVDVVTAATGGTDPEQVAAALADRERAAQISLDLARIETEAETERLRLVVADIASARGQTVALAQSGSAMAWAAPIISIVVVCGFFACVVLVMAAPKTWDERTAGLLNMLFGALVVGFSQVTSYWLGSSSGSKRSGDAVREIATAKVAADHPAATIATTTSGGIQVTAAQPAQARTPSPAGTTADDLNRTMGGLQP